MARKKAELKAKQFVKIRQKALANGNKSLYLDIYKDGERTYEYLKMYLIPERTAADRAENRNTMQLAESRRAAMQHSLLYEEAGVKDRSKGKVTLHDFLKRYIEWYEQQGKRGSNTFLCMSLAVNKYNGKIMLKDITAKYYHDFHSFLKETFVCQYGRGISTASIHVYLTSLSTALNKAVEWGCIPFNPFKKIAKEDRAKRGNTERAYLTIEERDLLASTPLMYGRHPHLKNAFMLSCFVGLRWSDIAALQWRNITETAGETRISVIMQKTGQQQTLIVPKKALQWLPCRGKAKASDKVFKLPSLQSADVTLHKWTAAAGIEKHISFHCSRHTFATSLLTKGADLYTTSKLLGHAGIETTQIYAKIIDKKKEETMRLLDD